MLKAAAAAVAIHEIKANSNMALVLLPSNFWQQSQSIYQGTSELAHLVPVPPAAKLVLHWRRASLNCCPEMAQNLGYPHDIFRSRRVRGR
jgi:hypothetical protein